MKTKNIWKINTIAAAIIAGGVVLPAAAETTATLEEVVVVGSRGAPRSVGDSPVPVDVISADELGRAGSNDLMMQLQSAVPSLNVHLQPISDAASMIRPANLRGLSSDSTLIMVNGKRRHRASVIAFQGGGVNDGSQGPDISVIPSIALKSVEVLRDGAAAQYGSDAVAGVINFVLNDSAEGGSLKVKQGQFSEGDGDTTVIMGNFGMPLTDAGFMNISFQMKDNEATSRCSFIIFHLKAYVHKASISKRHTKVAHDYSCVAITLTELALLNFQASTFGRVVQYEVDYASNSIRTVLCRSTITKNFY